MSSCTTIERLREPKVFGMALFDWAASLIGAWIIGAHLLGLERPLAWVAWLVAWIGLGVVAHLVAGVPTMFGYYLGLNAKPVRKNDRC